MEMKKLHMGTISYGYDSMDEVAHQLAMAFGAEQGTLVFLVFAKTGSEIDKFARCQIRIDCNRCTTCYSWPQRHVF